MSETSSGGLVRNDPEKIVISATREAEKSLGNEDFRAANREADADVSH